MRLYLQQWTVNNTRVPFRGLSCPSVMLAGGPLWCCWSSAPSGAGWWSSCAGTCVSSRTSCWLWAKTPSSRWRWRRPWPAPCSTAASLSGWTPPRRPAAPSPSGSAPRILPRCDFRSWSDPRRSPSTDVRRNAPQQTVDRSLADRSFGSRCWPPPHAAAAAPPPGSRSPDPAMVASTATSGESSRC